MKHLYKLLFTLLGVTGIILHSCAKGKVEKTKVLFNKFTSPQCNCYKNNVGDGLTINFNDSVPGDLLVFDQTKANCFAWQSFISLNWPTNGSNFFGKQGDKSFVQWETFMPKDVLFNAQGTKPPNWGTMISKEYIQKFDSQRSLLNKQNTKLLTFVKKATTSDTLEGLDISQAFPGNAPNWLGAQNRTNVWYEIMLNKDYYDFVVEKGYYNAATQHDSILAGIPINFPQGEYGTNGFDGATGAIELKAAWMEVTDQGNKKWNRYKLSKATVLDPYTSKHRVTTVALVGLHILHKTQNQPTWVWATFEHVDNVPGSSDSSSYNFYNENCTDTTVTLKNGKTVTVTCKANTPPPYYLTDAPPVPIQITRQNPIDPNNAKPINKEIQQAIDSLYNKSVYQYYELVDVIWAQAYMADPTTPVTSPRNIAPATMTSGANIVANTTMESYIQNTTCYQCHARSTIAPFPPDSLKNNIFADFSFAIRFAGYTKFQKEHWKSSAKKEE
ncbi:cytochrome c family protein [Aquimarina aquimarini]|uniref:cytochrome c family protein n=1 Tax=Aquimarina aquimarini TaxID=1191734 RepID=UPI000D5568E7|nr:cytochrome c family protein [Aquimarina aquimarini]